VAKSLLKLSGIILKDWYICIFLQDKNADLYNSSRNVKIIVEKAQTPMHTLKQFLNCFSLQHVKFMQESKVTSL
jgi:hypothetical protein